MYAATSARISLRDRVKLGAVTALLMLSLAVGTIATVRPVNAAPPAVAVSAPEQGDITIISDDGVAAKGKGGKGKGKSKSNTECITVIDEQTWYVYTGERAGADWVGGMVCFKKS